MSKIIFSYHSIEKIKMLKEHGFYVNKRSIINVVRNPDEILDGYKGRKIAQKNIDDKHILRIVFTEENDYKRIITIYPGRRSRYEN